MVTRIAIAKEVVFALTLAIFLIGIIFLQQHQRAGAQTTSSTTNSTFQTFNDPQGRFTISYPSNWTITPATNRFQANLLTVENGAVTFGVGPIKHVPGYDVERELQLAMPTIRAQTPNFQLSQDVECTKYSIEGKKTCSYIFSRTTDYVSDVHKGVMQVTVQFNDKDWIFSYVANLDDFDRYLPIIDKMIGSFKVQ